MTRKRFFLGDWTVEPSVNSLCRGTERRRLEPRAMEVLQRLCRDPGVVVSPDELIEACWGEAEVGDNPLHRTITQLRQALGDSSTAPTYIETIRKRGYRICAEITADSAAIGGSWTHTTPFRGLHAFEEQHASIFFGRTLATDRLADTVRQQSAGGCAMVLVLGPSGAGKSSLIRAGLLPRLTAITGDASVLCVLHMNCIDIGEATLFQALGSTLLDAEMANGVPIFPGASSVTLGESLVTNAAALCKQLPRLGVALCIDHFEAIFRWPHISEEERQLFVSVLETLARSGAVLVVMACRNDFYPRIAAYPTLLELKLRGGHFDVCPPTRSELAQMVCQPARAALIEFEVDATTGVPLSDVLCDAISDGHDTLPLLQYCLQELYLQRGHDNLLSYTVFNALGGIEGAIGARAEQVVAVLTHTQTDALPRVLALLVQVAEDEMAVTSRSAPWSALHSAAERELVQVLVDARLFVSDLHGGVSAFGVAHEAILRRWPRVIAWIAQHRQTLQLRTRTSAQAARWHASGSSRDLLLPAGIQVNQARTLLDKQEFPLNAEESAFIGASVQRALRAERLRLLVLSMVLILAGFAIVLGFSARHAEQIAEQRRTQAEGLMGFMLGEFVDKLRPIGRLDLLDSVSGRALNYLSEQQDSSVSATALTQRAQALQVIAEVALARGDPTGATSALKLARTILDRQLAATPTDKAVLKNLGNNAFYMGQLQFDQKAWGAARVHMSDYLQFSERLGRIDPDDPSAWIEQSYAHNSLGSIALESGDVEGAARAFDASVTLKQKALARNPRDKGLAADLADSLSWSADAKEKLGQLAAAAQLYQRELAIMLALQTASPNDALYAHRLSNAYVHNGELQHALGQSTDARISYEHAEQLLHTIFEQDRSNKSWQAQLGIVRIRLFDLTLEQSPPTDRQASLQQLHDSFASLSALEPKKIDLRRWLAIIQQRKAALYLRQRELLRARQLLSNAMDSLNSLHALASGDTLVRDALVDAMLLQTELEQAEKSPQRTFAACLSVITLLGPTAATSLDYRVLAPWVRAHVCAGKVNEVSQQRALLWKMAYRESAYMRDVENHPPTKGVTSYVQR